MCDMWNIDIARTASRDTIEQKVIRESTRARRILAKVPLCLDSGLSAWRVVSNQESGRRIRLKMQRPLEGEEKANLWNVQIRVVTPIKSTKGPRLPGRGRGAQSDGPLQG